MAMSVVGLGFAELFILLLGGGASPAAFLSLPPLPPDTKLAAVAPQDCLVYLSWAGAADAKPDSANATERLAAEPQVRALFKSIRDEVKKAFAQEVGRDPEGAVVAQNLPLLIETLFLRPAAFYLGDFQMGPRGPAVTAALVVNVGDQADAVHAAMTKMNGLMMAMAGGGQNAPAKGRQVAGATFVPFGPAPGPGMQVEWAMIKNYAVITLGTGSAEHVAGVLTKAGAAAPAWRSAIDKRLPVPRPSTVGYLNIRKASQLLPMMAGPQGAMIAGALGLNSVDSVASVTGLDEKGYVSKTLIAMHEKPAGIMAMLPSKPLEPSAVAHIPADATLATAVNMDATDVYQKMRAMVGQIEPRAAAGFAEFEQEFQRELGFRLQEDLLAHLGTTWTLYSSPSDGGLIFTGLTATVDLRNAASLQRTHDILLGRIMAEMSRGGGRQPDVAVGTVEHRGHRIHFLNPIREDEMPFALAWCITKDRFVISAFPQMVKSYLDRAANPDPAKSLSANPAVAALFKEGKPTSIGYADTAEVFRLAYPLLHPLLTLACAEMQKEGINVNIAMLPTASSIQPHLSSGVSSTRMTSDGLLMMSRDTLPFGNQMVGLQGMTVMWAGMMPMMVMQAGHAREQAQVAVAMNTLRQVAVAAHAYAADQGGKLPNQLQDLRAYVGNNPRVLRDQNGRPFIYFGKGRKLGDIKNPSVFPVFAESTVRNNQRQVAYADGHVQRVSEGVFRRQLQQAGIKYTEAQLRGEPADAVLRPATRP